MPTIKESLERILRDLREENIEVSAIATRDGLIMASDTPKSVPRETLAAMAATMYKAAEVATAELKKAIRDV
ncbi:MAG: roadblock/LC7 domain-containing protein [Methanocellales archaeon]|nr:roadblock/LC7 domain-containing protein [Methanocellales archaeon]